MLKLPRTELTCSRGLRPRVARAFLRGKPTFFLALLFVFSLLFFSLVTPARAQIRLDAYREAVKDDKYNLQQHGSEFLGTVTYGLINALAGCEDCPEDYRSGAIGTMGTMIAGMYAAPPASGVMYAMDVMDNLKIVEPAYAQGTGFRVLQPLLPIWRAFRNFTYALFVLAFVALGFAIMFRVKISPQAAISIQSALPRIVVALLLVTFSYAIVGFVVDLIYVSIALITLLFQGMNPPGIQNIQAVTDQFFTGGFPNTIGALFSVVGFQNIAGSAGIFALVGGAIGAAIGGLTSLVPGALIGVGLGVGIVILIILLIILYLIFKLFIELLKAYIGIILAVILAPFQILLGVFPGFPGAGQWFKGLLANAMVFPAVAFVLLLGRVLVHGFDMSGLWSAPLLGGGEIIPMLLGFGILLIVYQVPPAIKKAMGVEEFGFAPGATLQGAVGRVAGFGMGLSTAQVGSRIGAIAYRRGYVGEAAKDPRAALWRGIADWAIQRRYYSPPGRR